VSTEPGSGKNSALAQWRLLNFWRGGQKEQDMVVGVLYIIPALFFIGVFIIYPVLLAGRLSLHDVHLVRTQRPFVGLEQYKDILADPLFWLYVRNTITYAAIVLPTALILGMVFALTLNKEMPFKNILRAMVFMPWVLPEVVVASFWKFLLDGNTGLLNEALLRLHLISSYQSWLGSQQTALATTALVMAWRTYPFMTILLLAGLQTIPVELYESAAVDGATAWQRFWHITLPMMRYVLAVAGIVASLWSLQSFTIIYVLTGGGPFNSSRVLSLSIYDTAFRFFKLGRASALSVILFVAILGLAIVYVRQLRLTEEEE
jgi:multiple sugar transport system permease protein